MDGEPRGRRIAVRERRILELRHLAGIRALEEAGDRPEYAAADAGALPDGRAPGRSRRPS